MALSASDLAAMRTTVDAFNIDAAINSRTSASIPVYVSPNARLYSIERGLRFRSVLIRADWQADILPGDVLTVGTTGYAVQERDTPRSNATQMDCVTVPTALNLASFFAPEQATFQHRTDLTKTVPASVYVTSHLEDTQTYGGAPAYPWTIVFENTVAYPGGGKIGADHKVQLASVFGTDANGNARAGVITRPQPILHGLPFMLCYAKDPAS